MPGIIAGNLTDSPVDLDVSMASTVGVVCSRRFTPKSTSFILSEFIPSPLLDARRGPRPWKAYKLSSILRKCSVKMSQLKPFVYEPTVVMRDMGTWTRDGGIFRKRCHFHEVRALLQRFKPELNREGRLPSWDSPLLAWIQRCWIKRGLWALLLLVSLESGTYQSLTATRLSKNFGGLLVGLADEEKVWMVISKFDPDRLSMNTSFFVFTMCLKPPWRLFRLAPLEIWMLKKTTCQQPITFRLSPLPTHLTTDAHNERLSDTHVYRSALPLSVFHHHALEAGVYSLSRPSSVQLKVSSEFLHTYRFNENGNEWDSINYDLDAHFGNGPGSRSHEGSEYERNESAVVRMKESAYLNICQAFKPSNLDRDLEYRVMGPLGLAETAVHQGNGRSGEAESPACVGSIGFWGCQRFLTLNTRAHALWNLPNLLKFEASCTADYILRILPPCTQTATSLSLLLNTQPTRNSFAPFSQERLTDRLSEPLNSIDPSTVGAVVSGIASRCDCSGTGEDGRTIYDIVKSCLFTIAACVYRAVHQNIPDPELGFWGRLRVTAKVTFYALIAPEMIIWWAMRQWFGARKAAHWMNLRRGEHRLNWTKVHGQFAQMGGFARKDDKRVLHPTTLLDLLDKGQIDIDELRLTEKEIQDKSKGDILSKTLVAFQTTWFVFECIARLQQGLPLIELEVVTLAFATLNIITYGLWWYKPLNVLCPIYIHVRPEASDPQSNAEVASPGEEVVGGGETNVTESGELSEVQVKLLAASNTVAGVSSSGRGAVVGETERTKKAESGAGSGKTQTGSVGRIVADIKNDIKNDGWWWMLWKRLIKQPFVAVVWPLLELLNDSKGHDDATHVSTFFAEGTEFDELTWVECLSSLIGIVFGAIHFLSWHSTFPTHVELLLWRTSSVALVVPPFFLLLRALSFRIHIDRLGTLFSYISFFGGPVPYILARFCVLVLAFLTLHDLPSGALTNVSWTSYIPHL
ncbi:hypothetical protein BDN72DRAFT_865109 [Pluteus cervinus]|uniref:Uncharacterized protein n=1 Tax=Pluteus cervinus TaxID=181527 RepID=A0ACD3A1D9_9AGAR|nr:hypothetical protein BDN72DRAFT_865109 [Pluteus cervinus]